MPVVPVVVEVPAGGQPSDPSLQVATAATTRPGTQSQVSDPSMPASTTFQQDLMAAGQRAINLKWEDTQAKIALWVVIGSLVVDGTVTVLLVVTGRELTASTAMVLGFLHMITSNVLSFYFSRTNHTQVGGVGPKAYEIREAGR